LNELGQSPAQTISELLDESYGVLCVLADVMEERKAGGMVDEEVMVERMVKAATERMKSK
jgi:hypothetical protein